MYIVDTCIMYLFGLIHIGPSSIDYVADSGEEMYTHTYDSVLRWTSGHDSVSFAYMTSSGDTTMCHSFQCLDPNEVSHFRITHIHSYPN